MSNDKARDDLEAAARAAGFSMACEDNVAASRAAAALPAPEAAVRQSATADLLRQPLSAIAHAKAQWSWTPGWSPWKATA